MLTFTLDSRSYLVDTYEHVAEPAKPARPASPPPPQEPPPASPVALPLAAKRPAPAAVAAHTAAAAALMAMEPLPPQTMRALLIISDRDAEEHLYSIVPLQYCISGGSPSWLLKNHSKPASYTVRCGRDGTWTCSCPGGAKANRHGPCKHVRALRAQRQQLVVGLATTNEGEPWNPQDGWASYENFLDALPAEPASADKSEAVECPF